MTEKIPLFAPTPTASVSTAITAKLTYFVSIRTPYRISCHRPFIAIPARVLLRFCNLEDNPYFNRTRS